MNGPSTAAKAGYQLCRINNALQHGFEESVLPCCFKHMQRRAYISPAINLYAQAIFSQSRKAFSRCVISSKHAHHNFAFPKTFPL